ncbi:MAG: hypothetical protein Tsb0014_37460 [Pleurocapsa sp.]
MDRELIIQTLKNACDDRNLRFQVITEDSLWHIYINRKTDRIPDYSLLSATIEKAIARLNIPDLEGLWLYSRVLGEIEPDWQTFIELNLFPTTLGESQRLTDTPLKDSSLAAIKTENQESTAIESEDLIQNVDSDFSNEESEVSQDFTLSSYCFIQNQGLLSSSLLPPQLKIAKIVQFLHNLPDYAQQQTLPLLQTYFQRRKLPDISDLTVGIQNWFKQITDLSQPETRKAAIWLSRYCFEPEATMSQIQSVLDAEAVKAAAQAEAQIAEPSNMSELSNESEVISSSNSDTLYRRRHQLDPRNEDIDRSILHNKILLIPAAWIAATLICIVLGINVVRSSPEMATICQNFPGSPHYCKLAVSLVGEKKMEAVLNQTSTYAFTSKQKQLSVYACQRYANVKAGIPFKDADPRDTPAISTSGETVLSNIYVVTSKQNNFRKEGEATVRVGCAYASGENEKFPVLLASDTIPNNWPQESYQGNSLNLSPQSFGIFSFFIFYGVNTIFAAVGIFLAAAFGLGIKVNQLQTIYLAAVILGFMEAAVANLPIFGFVANVALQTLALGMTSIFVRGFKIDWSLGSKIIAAGAVTVMGTNWVLRWLFYLFLYSFVD